MIKIKGLKKQFGSQRVLDGVDLNIEQGEQVAILGPSGCGKSTLLRLLMTLIEPDQGSIEYLGQDIFAQDEQGRLDLRAQFGMVFQHSALFDSLSVGENVGLFLQERLHWPEEKILHKVEQTLSLVELSGKAHLMPAELSGGMQKRVSLARAIAHDPKVILYDEPTTGLDPQLSTAIERLMRSLSQKLAITSVVVTHQISTVHRTADRVVFLKDGRPIEAGNPEQALHSDNPIIRQFMTGELA